MAGLDLAKVVSRRDEMQWNEGEWSLGQGFAQPDERQLHVVAYDFGVKRNILRMLTSRGCRVTVVPAQTPARRVLELQPDGVFLSNGPGDPEPCDYAIAATQEFLRRELPTFGICLGHHAAGERARHPCQPVRRQPSRHRADRSAGLQLPGASGGQPRAARHWLAVRPFCFDDGEEECLSAKT